MSREQMQHERWLKGVDHVLKTVRHMFTCATIAFGLYLIRAAISDLAGKTTLADIALSLWVTMRARDWISAVCAVVALMFGLSQWHLRRRNIKQLSDRRVYLERQIDPARESSQLTETGDTRPEDR